jgi:hypothetical protein
MCLKSKYVPGGLGQLCRPARIQNANGDEAVSLFQRPTVEPGEWKWGLDQSNCGWYPAVSAAKENEWAPVLEEIISAIRSFRYG